MYYLLDSRSYIVSIKQGEFSLTPAAMDQTPQEENVEVSHVVTLKDVG